MPVNRQALPLGASPRSVADARRWVVAICEELGRDDLVESAQLAVSELVTNAILHGTPPLTVRVRGTHEHPRVEVSDGSREPPVPKLPDEDDLLSTIGRGLDIVAMCSAAWGAHVETSGKVVWFVPTPEPDPDTAPDGDLYEVDHEPALPTGVPGSEVTLVCLLGVPVRDYLDFRNHYRELRRELRLIALAHGTEYPIARHLSDLFARFESEAPMLLGLDGISEALDTREETVDLEVKVPVAVLPTIKQSLTLLKLADTFCRSERLLAVATSEQQQRFEDWYFGEFIEQVGGRQPRAWKGLAAHAV